MINDLNWSSYGVWTTSPTFTSATTTGVFPVNPPPELTILPPELTVCQICGAEGVVVFCVECKDILQLARQKWAETMMEEIEDALS